MWIVIWKIDERNLGQTFDVITFEDAYWDLKKEQQSKINNKLLRLFFISSYLHQI